MAKIEAGEKNSKIDGVKRKTYLTEMKELPPESEEVDMTTKPVSKEPPPFIANAELPKKEPLANPVDLTVSGFSESFNALEEDVDVGNKLPISARDAILGIVNLISVILLILILVKFPEKAQELKVLRVEEFVIQETSPIEFREIEEAKVKIDDLQSLFLDDSGIVDFVNAAETIKSEDQVITRISFASQKAVKDKTGSFGLPVVIEMLGSWENIDKSLGKLDVLPFLFKPMKADIERSKDDPGVIILKYGVFLYVSDQNVAK